MNIKQKSINQRLVSDIKTGLGVMVKTSNKELPRLLFVDNDKLKQGRDLTTKEMRDLATFLNKAADHIEADKDLMSK